MHGGAGGAPPRVQVEGRALRLFSPGLGGIPRLRRRADRRQVAVAEKYVAAEEAVEFLNAPGADRAFFDARKKLRVDALASELVDQLVVVDLAAHRPRVHHHLCRRWGRRRLGRRRCRCLGGRLVRGLLLRRGGRGGGLRSGLGRSLGGGVAHSGVGERGAVDGEGLGFAARALEGGLGRGRGVGIGHGELDGDARLLAQVHPGFALFVALEAKSHAAERLGGTADGAPGRVRCRREGPDNHHLDIPRTRRRPALGLLGLLARGRLVRGDFPQPESHHLLRRGAVDDRNL
mmetsp:Transcript_47633/g.108062  ORF Transcript_47633/g.108062 Transcript_47633/m.108062 type:complete len:290 (-) Transcript_47633:300-1169(-)